MGPVIFSVPAYQGCLRWLAHLLEVAGLGAGWDLPVQFIPELMAPRGLGTPASAP